MTDTDSGRSPTEPGFREQWEWIEGYEGLYQVSDLGRVCSHYGKGKILARYCCRDGYPLISLTKGGKRTTFQLHTIVCKTFNGPPNPLHCEVAHLDGKRSNVAASNLKWVSRIENMRHKRIHGTAPRGEKHPSSILTLEQVREIRAKKGTRRRAQLAAKYGVSPHTIYDIWSGRRWRHVA